MLVLSRKMNQRIVIGSDTVVRVLSVHGGRVRLGIEAPKNVKVLRGELFSRENDDEEANGKNGGPGPGFDCNGDNGG